METGLNLGCLWGRTAGVKPGVNVQSRCRNYVCCRQCLAHKHISDMSVSKVRVSLDFQDSFPPPPPPRLSPASLGEVEKEEVKGR